MLTQAVQLRETIEDSDAIAASRRNLSFVLAPVAIASRGRETTRFDDVGDLDSLPLRYEVQPAVRVARRTRASAILPVTLLFVTLGGLAYWAGQSELLWTSWDGAGRAPVLQSGIAGTTVATEIALQPARAGAEPRVLRFSAFPDVIARGESLGLCYEVANGTRVRIDPGFGDVGPLQRNCVQASPLETTTYVLTAQGESEESVRQTVLVRVGLGSSTPRTPVANRASILIFTPRPGSIATGTPTALCYAVNGAVHARIEPGVGEVNPASALTCLRVAPPRTTTYELIAYGRDGDRARQQLVIFVR